MGEKPFWRRVVLRTPLSLLVGSRPHTEWVRRRNYRRWIEAGSPIPAPPEAKQLIVRRTAQEHGCRVLVETGTYSGDMLVANLRQFSRLVSIELDDDLWKRATTLLGGVRNVTLLHGDSAELLPGVVAELDERALFWLDAHFSGGATARGNLDTPIEAELRTILAAPTYGHVVLIDDAREFGQGDYPSLDVIKRLIAPRELIVEDDVIRICI